MPTVPAKKTRNSRANWFEDAPVAMHEIDREGVVRRVNRAECELLGFPPEELLGRHASDFVAPAGRAASRDAVRRKLAGEPPPGPFRREFERRDGAKLVLEIHEVPIRDARGRVTGMRSALLDVTEQHRASEQLRQAREELEARVRERTLELAAANEALRSEVAERRRAERRLAAQYAAARALAGAKGAADGLPRVLEALGRSLDWQLGVYWAASGGGPLVCRGLWGADAELAERLAASTVDPGRGVAGEVWAGREPAWIGGALEAALGTDFPIPGNDFRAGLALPVLAGTGPLGVVALFSRAAHVPDPQMLATAALVGSQIGQFLERTAAEDALRSSESRFTAFMDHLPAVAFLKDGDGRYLYFNPAVRSLLGLDPAGMIGKTDREVWPAEFAVRVVADDRHVLETGQALERLEQLPLKEGPRAWLVYKFPVPDRDGRRRLLGAIGFDVTERQLLEEQLRQSQKMDAIGRLAGGVAHDFNNLLTIIGGYGRMVLEQLPPADRSRGSMELILNAADRAAVLTSQLLAFSRRQVVQPKVLELNHVVSNLEKMLHRVIGEHIVLETVLDPRLAPVKADSGQIEQVLMNLAINARDAMPKGGTLTIQTANAPHFASGSRPDAQPAPHVRLSVIDTGVGMDAQTRARIFEPFFTTKGRGKGTGLGLSTVYGIVKQHGGDIVVESQPGAGAAFHIYFPVAPDGDREEAPETARRGMRRGTETVLLVEDEAGVRKLTADMLRASGYRVLEAAEGRQAMEILERECGAVDLLLTDMIMPLMSGRELAHRVQRKCPGVRVVFMSGYTDDVIAYHGGPGPDGEFWQKPFTPDVLARKIRDVLDAGKPAAKPHRMGDRE